MNTTITSKNKSKTKQCITSKIKNRYQWRLMFGGCSNRKYHKTIKRTRTKRKSYKKKHKRYAGEWNAIQHNHFGFKWDRQSCWMDASLMALFYSDALYSSLYPYFNNNTNSKINDVKETLLQCISEMRSPNAQPELHGLRSILAQHIKTREQKYAFQLENELGYVFYFIQELLKMFNVKCMRAVSPEGKNYQRLFVMEMDSCNNNTVEQCLSSAYQDWTFHEDIANYMIIELIDEDGKYSVQPQENIRFLGKEWNLCSMIVFDCSHFISYVKERNKWYLYDDTRSLSHKELDPYSFGSFYSNGSCRFQYGKNNTFFFYTLNH